MSSLNVQQYKDSDFSAVRRIFTEGCCSHTLPTFYNALTFPHNWFLMLLSFLLPLVTLGSIFLAILDVIIVLVVLWLSGREFFHSYARKTLAEDLQDIPKYYLQRRGYNFWVVESKGEVVGMVAAIPSYLPGGEKHTELKRMCVTKSHRGKGIAKLLCRTIIDFARKEGCKAVILSTTTIQRDAVHLYRKMGFKCMSTHYMTKFTERLVRLEWINLRYDITFSQ